MTIYARIVDGQVDRLIDLTTDQYESLVANGKASYLRLWVIDAKPTPTATQVVIDAGIVIGPLEAHQTWGLRDKTQAELDAEARETERPTLVALVSALTADITAYNANPDVTGTAVERLTKLEARVKDLERQNRRANAVLRYYLKGLA